MAGATMNDIKARIKSVSSTKQITKAMELVATSKLRRAKERLERSRPFYELLGEAIDEIEASSDVQSSIWSKDTGSSTTLYIVIAGDRGLAGGYNSNIFRLTESLVTEGEAIYLPIGKKALEYCKNREKNIYSSVFEYVDDVAVGDTLSIAENICKSFKAGEFGRVVLIYTRFDSMLVQVPMQEVLLPIDRGEDKADKSFSPIYEGETEELLDKIVPEYIAGVIYSTVCESITSELGARRTAMDAASKNATEIIDSLMLQFNRARQSVITQEITEIVSGSEAL